MDKKEIIKEVKRIKDEVRTLTLEINDEATTEEVVIFGQLLMVYGNLDIILKELSIKKKGGE